VETEIGGAGAEAVHLWDRRQPCTERPKHALTLALLPPLTLSLLPPTLPPMPLLGVTTKILLPDS
jgi:hypothetical protein